MPVRPGPGGEAADPLAPAAAWDSGDLGALASTTYSDTTYTVGGATMTVANSANCTSIGPDGTNGIKITTPQSGTMYGATDDAVQISWAISDLLGETPGEDYLYVVQFVISSAGDEPSTTDDGMLMGLVEASTTLDKVATYQHGSNFKRLHGGSTRLQTVGDLTTDLITCNLRFQRNLLYGVQLSSSEESVPFFADDALATTLQTTNPSTMDPTSANFRLVWGSYVSGATTDSYILKRVRLWAFGKAS